MDRESLPKLEIIDLTWLHNCKFCGKFGAFGMCAFELGVTYGYPLRTGLLEFHKVKVKKSISLACKMCTNCYAFNQRKAWFCVFENHDKSRGEASVVGNYEGQVIDIVVLSGFQTNGCYLSPDCRVYRHDQIRRCRHTMFVPGGGVKWAA